MSDRITITVNGEVRVCSPKTKLPHLLEEMGLNLRLLAVALDEGSDYIGVGPVYETPTKAGKAAIGLEYLRYVAKNCPVPWYAIGGIDMQNFDDVLAAGAQRVAVVRAIMQAEQPTLVTQYFISQLNRYQQLQAHKITPERSMK